MPLLRRKTRENHDVPKAGPYAPGWDVPARFNFTRDVVEALATDPLKPALTFVDREGIVDRRSFHEIAGDAARWAHLMRTRLDRGDRVVLAIGKVPSWQAAMLGALKSGLVAVPCPDMLRARDLAFRVHNSGARLVVADRSLELEIEEMRHQVGASVSVLFLDEALDELRRYMPVAPTEDTTAGETALILYTSGTDKDPKGVVHTHAYTWAQRAQATHWLDAHEGDVVWCTSGTGWAKAIWNSLIGPWSHGAEIVVHEGSFDPEERLSLLQRLGVTILCQAPTEYRMLAKLEKLELAHLPRLRHAVSAGEPLNPEVIARFQDALGLTVHDGYGQTENSLLVANTPGVPIRPGSMGLPTPGHDVAVIDEAGHVCPPGVEGNLALIGRPPTLFTGYWDAPEETDAVFRDGWYLTGDRAQRDEDGYLWFVGRSDDVIVSAAYRISPFEVESALLEHPAVAESAVVGVPDLDRGQIVKAFVVLRPGQEPTGRLATELQEHVKAVTAPYKYPRSVAFLDELPKTASGKIRRSELRELHDQLGIEPLPVLSIVPEPDPAELARQEAEAAALRQAEAAAAAERARVQAAEAARRDAEEAARRKAQEAARRAAEADAAERARAGAEEAARREAEEAEARARAEAEEAARREAEEAEGAAGREAEEAARREAEAAEARARAQAEETARREAEEAEARARAQAEETARREAEEAEARARAEETARREAEEPARREAEEAEARARAEAEETARREAEEAEARARAEAEETARREAEEAEARARAEEDSPARSRGRRGRPAAKPRKPKHAPAPKPKRPPGAKPRKPKHAPAPRPRKQPAAKPRRPRGDRRRQRQRKPSASAQKRSRGSRRGRSRGGARAGRRARRRGSLGRGAPGVPRRRTEATQGGEGGGQAARRGRAPPGQGRGGAAEARRGASSRGREAPRGRAEGGGEAAGRGGQAPRGRGEGSRAAAGRGGAHPGETRRRAAQAPGSRRPGGGEGRREAARGRRAPAPGRGARGRPAPRGGGAARPA